MNTAHTTSTAIHRAERLVCGCVVDPRSGEKFVACHKHREYVFVREYVSIDELRAMYPHREIAVIQKKDGLSPLCPVCSSQHLKPAGINIRCMDCEALFAASDITGYGLSDDGEARQCHLCNAIYRGAHDCSLPEAAL